MKTMTVKQYSEISGVSVQGINYRLRKGRSLPGIDSVSFDVTDKGVQYSVLHYTKKPTAESTANHFRKT